MSSSPFCLACVRFGTVALRLTQMLLFQLSANFGAESENPIAPLVSFLEKEFEEQAVGCSLRSCQSLGTNGTCRKLWRRCGWRMSPLLRFE
jgi:hypothetical protein